MSSKRVREHRTPVAIKARVKSDIGWSDSRICNVSPRGMMVRHIPPPPIGSYVEVCRGPFSIVGRVRWISGDRFGLQSLENIDLDALNRQKRTNPGPVRDRRSRPRPAILNDNRSPDPASCLERSQRFSRRLQFVVTILAGGAMAFVAAQLMVATLASPLAKATVAMGSLTNR